MTMVTMATIVSIPIYFNYILLNLFIYTAFAKKRPLKIYIF